MSSQPNAISEPFIAVRPDGQRVNFQLVVSLPYRVVESNDRTWNCAASLVPLFENEASGFFGATSFHALSSAIVFAVTLLTTFTEQGGKILLPSGEQVKVPDLKLVQWKKSNAV